MLYGKDLIRNLPAKAEDNLDERELSQEKVEKNTWIQPDCAALFDPNTKQAAPNCINLVVVSSTGPTGYLPKLKDLEGRDHGKSEENC